MQFSVKLILLCRQALNRHLYHTFFFPLCFILVVQHSWHTTNYLSSVEERKSIPSWTFVVHITTVWLLPKHWQTDSIPRKKTEYYDPQFTDEERKHRNFSVKVWQFSASNLRYPCPNFSQQLVVYNSFYVQSTTTGIFRNSCKHSIFWQVQPQDLDSKKLSRHLWKVSFFFFFLSLPLSLFPCEMTSISAQLYHREKEKTNFSRVALNCLDHEITSFCFLQSSTSFIMQPSSPSLHSTVISPQTAEKEESQGEGNIWPFN